MTSTLLTLTPRLAEDEGRRRRPTYPGKQSVDIGRRVVAACRDYKLRRQLGDRRRHRAAENSILKKKQELATVHLDSG